MASLSCPTASSPPTNPRGAGRVPGHSGVRWRPARSPAGSAHPQFARGRGPPWGGTPRNARRTRGARRSAHCRSRTRQLLIREAPTPRRAHPRAEPDPHSKGVRRPRARLGGGGEFSQLVFRHDHDSSFGSSMRLSSACPSGNPDSKILQGHARIDTLGIDLGEFIRHASNLEAGNSTRRSGRPAGVPPSIPHSPCRDGGDDSGQRTGLGDAGSLDGGRVAP